MTSTSLLKLAEDLQRLNDINLFWDRIDRELQNYGVAGMLYACAASKQEVEERGLSSSIFFKSNYPTSYFEAFPGASFADHDLTSEHSYQSSSPIFWHHDEEWEAATKEQKYQFEVEADLGFDIGVTVPTASHTSMSLGGVGLWFNDEDRNTFGGMWVDKQREIVSIVGLLEIGMRQQHFSSVVGLSSREKEVLEWLASGLRPDQIADRLAIGYRTVDKYVVSAKYKLNATTRDHAVAKALILNLIHP